MQFISFAGKLSAHCFEFKPRNESHARSFAGMAFLLGIIFGNALEST